MNYKKFLLVHVGTCRRQRNWLNMIKEFNSGPVVPKEDSSIHWINLCPLDSAIGFPNAYPLDRDLSGG